MLKLFLHVGKGEQKKRLSERLSNPRKHWKLSYGDIHERALWDAYIRTYTEFLETTSTEPAPWYATSWSRDSSSRLSRIST